nr:MAG TPA: hypothetical protein [Caudoviricetes sp.]
MLKTSSIVEWYLFNIFIPHSPYSRYTKSNDCVFKEVR